MHYHLYPEKQRLDRLFDRLKTFVGDEELAAHWSRYLCVLLSGFIENAIRILVTTYITEKSHPYVASYASRQVGYLTNLNEEKICQFLGSFSDTWRQTLESRITDAQKTAIDSIVANRHNIAHGRSVGVSPVVIQEYYSRVLEVITILEDECIQ